MVNPLPAGRIVAIHERLVEVFADLEDPISPPGMRDENLVHMAAQRPATGLGRAEKYPTVVSKAAALFHSLITSHPFHNGNKRTALVSLATFLNENHRRLVASDDETFEFVLSVAQGSVPGAERPGNTDAFVQQIADWIEEHSSHLPIGARSMKIRDFLEYVEQLGAKVKRSKGGVLVIGDTNKSIRLSGSTSKLDGMAVRVFVNKLGLSEAKSGIRFEEFQAGLVPDQAYITGLMAVLRRLAHA